MHHLTFNNYFYMQIYSPILLRANRQQSSQSTTISWYNKSCHWLDCWTTSAKGWYTLDVQLACTGTGQVLVRGRRGAGSGLNQEWGGGSSLQLHAMDWWGNWAK